MSRLPQHYTISPTLREGANFTGFTEWGSYARWESCEMWENPESRGRSANGVKSDKSRNCANLAEVWTLGRISNSRDAIFCQLYTDPQIPRLGPSSRDPPTFPISISVPTMPIYQLSQPLPILPNPPQFPPIPELLPILPNSQLIHISRLPHFTQLRQPSNCPIW